MNVDIVVNGRKVGTAKIQVDIPESTRKRHAITAAAVLQAAVEGSKPQAWYCMGAVQLIRQA